MAAKDRVERQLEHLKTLRTAGVSDLAVKDLRRALADRVNVIVAKASDIAGEWQAQSLRPDLLATFARLLDHPETDPQCWGKNSIARVLKDLGCSESAPFMRGLYHHQYEAVWGGKSDTSGVLRGTCALALVQCSDIPRHEILCHLIAALTEPDSSSCLNARVRTDAARALEQMAGRDVELLLRLKARAGDSEVQVTGQVLEAIIQLEGVAGVSFVAAFLAEANEEIVEEAALALGASRLPEAIEILKQECSKTKIKHGRGALLRALSASRQDAALDFLLDQVRTARVHAAKDAMQALELHRDSDDIVNRLEAAVAGREELETVFQEKFR